MPCQGVGVCRLAAAEKQAAEEREQLRDLEERLLRTEQFADATLASEAQAQAQATKLDEALAVRGCSLSDPSCLAGLMLWCWCCTVGACHQISRVFVSQP